METKAEAKEISNEILGSWELVSWTYEDETGKSIDYFGKPEGILIYNESGYMSVHISRDNRKSFESDGPFDGKPNEMINAFKTYFGYYGRFIESEPGILLHTIEGSSFPNWLGITQKRIARIVGKELTLSTPPIPTGTGYTIFTLVWKKIIN